jgi:hypothetical protein
MHYLDDLRHSLCRLDLDRDFNIENEFVDAVTVALNYEEFYKR